MWLRVADARSQNSGSPSQSKVDLAKVDLELSTCASAHREPMRDGLYISEVKI
jgi:hypothetical protein